ncbi:MAG: dnaX [Gammaproteobacteria bacterium]|jgi:DNA polymerase-3 subunit gamma/tau|nr:dnaX [Gammaproteobacteria bacterium]
MSYQVLARKWRPRTFADMVGQEHVLQALQNALTQQRLHHAYLLTGTRGVGKTTLGRILAKCFNCEAGISPTPCNTCETCQAIDAGRFVDLIEVDAASRTKVEDTRDLLDNVQYAPVQGRFKVYLIDEVHMLSGHSFNALLKTLEEPPEHVKFILATTDPQRLPVTILSRCLQFHLKHIPSELMVRQLAHIAEAEAITAETAAMTAIAEAADGSLRDALTLLDQAIAYTNRSLTTDSVHQMLGVMDNNKLITLVSQLKQESAAPLLQTVAELAEDGADFYAVFDQLLSLLHQLTLAHIVPGAMKNHALQSHQIMNLSSHFSIDEIQLLYQMALIAKRDLPLAPSPRMGFEMACIRLYTFTPASVSVTQAPSKMNQVLPPADSPRAVAPLPKTGEHTSAEIQSLQPDTWAEVVAQLPIDGLTRALAQHTTLKNKAGSQVELILEPGHRALLNPTQKQQLGEAIGAYLKEPIVLHINLGTSDTISPAKQAAVKHQAMIDEAKVRLKGDNTVQMIQSLFDAKMEPSSVEGHSLLADKQ